MQQVDIYKLIKAYRNLNEGCEFIMALNKNIEDWSKLSRKTERLYNQCKKINAEDEQKINEYLGMLNKLVDEFNDLKMKNRA